MDSMVHAAKLFKQWLEETTVIMNAHEKRLDQLTNTIAELERISYAVTNKFQEQDNWNKEQIQVNYALQKQVDKLEQRIKDLEEVVEGLVE